MALRFDQAFGSTADTRLRMQLNYDLARAHARSADICIKRLERKVA
jgi:plasmid maintenance system antidote protein VapI